jgi:very-short-patch-repair endonuclease
MHDREHAVAAIAGKQDDVITREQLLAAGLGRGAIAHRVAARQLHRRHRGVYLVGHAPPSFRALARAAILACGDGAVLSHRSAAQLWKLLPTIDGDIDITVPGRNPGSRPGIAIHRVAQLEPSERVLLDGLAVTSPVRTLLDLAATEPTADVEQALAEARVRRLATDDRLRSLAERAPTRRGAGAIRALLAQEAGPAFTDRGAAQRLLGLLRQTDLPAPETQVRLCGHKVDFLWRQQRLIVEVDGHQFHGHRGAFERDRRQGQRLIAAGFRVVRITWRQLVDEPLAVIARIAQALAV